jgi:VanZ family protein
MVLASSDSVYNLTSPPGPLQLLLRKSYSIGAFAIVGYLLAQALRASQRTTSILVIALAVGAYSLVIEVIQAIVGSHEGLVSNAIDVAFGAVGGYIGGLIRDRLG